MDIVADVVVGLVAALHLYFLVLEMFLWDTPTGRETFGLEPAFAAESKTLAANQGLYNGFLAAGLVWGLIDDRDDVKLFFLACVIVAGAYGAVTVSRRILVVQALPALVGFVLVRRFLGRRRPRASRGTPRGSASTRRAGCATPTPCGWRRRSRARGSC